MKHLRARAIRARGGFDFHSALHCFHPPCHRHRLGQKYLETRTPLWRSRQVFSGTILQHPRGRRGGEDREEEYFQFPACPVGNERTPRIRSRDRMLDTINNLLLITRASFELQISSAIREKRTARWMESCRSRNGSRGLLLSLARPPLPASLRSHPDTSHYIVATMNLSSSPNGLRIRIVGAIGRRRADEVAHDLSPSRACNFQMEIRPKKRRKCNGVPSRRTRGRCLI